MFLYRSLSALFTAGQRAFSTNSSPRALPTTKQFLDHLCSLTPKEISQLTTLSVHAYPFPIYPHGDEDSFTTHDFTDLIPLFPGLKLNTFEVQDPFHGMGISEDGWGHDATYDMVDSLIEKGKGWKVCVFRSDSDRWLKDVNFGRRIGDEYGSTSYTREGAEKPTGGDDADTSEHQGGSLKNEGETGDISRADRGLEVEDTRESHLSAVESDEESKSGSSDSDSAFEEFSGLKKDRQPNHWDRMIKERDGVDSGARVEMWVKGIEEDCQWRKIGEEGYVVTGRRRDRSDSARDPGAQDLHPLIEVRIQRGDNVEFAEDGEKDLTGSCGEHKTILYKMFETMGWEEIKRSGRYYADSQVEKNPCALL
ncbi:uncharacterized protein KY384_000887 [Bacidia gigantensis]|uniref:uncharacterized protein n=1 Tax=Bacidia gigantensis TaxID=2732470 RepID=UPI001D0426A3|nr:uncharacterized protein KY384_000887 [Bacidia gigantensis]KAG8534044.1 hypothetical protein KY384_000887 [Bacidia gigantensis]